MCGWFLLGYLILWLPLAPPISLASLTAWILYSWSYLRWVRDIESSSLFSFIIHEFLENKVSTLFIQHHVLENMVSLYLHELSEKEEILDGYEVYTQLFCV